MRRIIRITWDGFADDLSSGEAIREKLNQMDSENVSAESFQPKLSTRLTTERFVGDLLVAFETLSFMIKGYFPNPNSFSSTAD